LPEKWKNLFLLILLAPSSTVINHIASSNFNGIVLQNFFIGAQKSAKILKDDVVNWLARDAVGSHTRPRNSVPRKKRMLKKIVKKIFFGEFFAFALP